MSTTRRTFLKTASLCMAGDLLAGQTIFAIGQKSSVTTPDKSSANGPSDEFRFIEPFDGGVIHETCGVPVLGTVTDSTGRKLLKIQVSGTVPRGVKVDIIDPDGKRVLAKTENGLFSAEVLLKDRISNIKAEAVLNGKKKTILTRPVWAKNSYKRFRCYIDDHSFFLRDIVKHDYKSIFDCFYPAKLRELHKNFGAKIVLNCFYSTPTRDFNLSMFPDKYRSEFEKNADWLRVAFHSENEFPDEPYLHSSPEKVAADFDLVADELKRIAGSAYTAGNQIHWAVVKPDSYKVLADRGVKMLPTRPKTEGQHQICHFHLPDSVLIYLQNHQGWMDFNSGLIFYTASAGGCDWNSPEAIVKILTKICADPAKCDLINIAGHEQYWWPFYFNYVPDIFERYSVSFRFLLDRGYKPIWIDDGFFGGAE